MNLGNYTPDELQTIINNQTPLILNNMYDPNIQKHWKDYCKLIKKTEYEQNIFWISETPKQYIHYSTEYSNVRRLLKTHKNILIFAGAGMSVDSGLPVFRSENKTIFTPDFFNAQNIRNMCDSFQPHIGYKKLLEYCDNKNYYIMTSNIDRYFARAGFDQNKIIEIYGNIYNNQCIDKCHDKVYNYTIIECPECRGLMRPNVLQFGDTSWIDNTKEIDKQMSNWIDNNILDNILIIEIGAGIHIPTIREYSEILIEKNISLIRVNPDHWQVPEKYLRLQKNGNLLVGRVPMKTISFFKYLL